MEEIHAKHRRELRDLQSRITQKKKSATKKTRKGVIEECADLERELNEKHQAELAELNGGKVADSKPGAAPGSVPSHDNPAQIEDTTTSSLRTLQISADGEESDLYQDAPDPSNAPTQAKKQNRRKARLAKRAAEQESQAAQAAEEASILPDLREQEKRAMQKQFKDRNLLEREIRPDGHCLYSAVASQLKDVGIGLSPAIDMTVVSNADVIEGYQHVRKAAANFMLEHPDDFAPFLDEPFDGYVAKITDTAEWGGQLELQAIARAYGVDVNVLQASGRTEKIEAANGSAEKQIWLAYYRHYFGLGEHYNALRDKTAKLQMTLHSC